MRWKEGKGRSENNASRGKALVRSFRQACGRKRNYEALELNMVHQQRAF